VITLVYGGGGREARENKIIAPKNALEIRKRSLLLDETPD